MGSMLLGHHSLAEKICARAAQLTNVHFFTVLVKRVGQTPQLPDLCRFPGWPEGIPNLSTT
jgi:hypothetical protein